MIFVQNKIYGKVWKVTKAEKYLDLQMSTSEKTKDGQYINSTWFPRVIGHAFNTLKDTLNEGDRILITQSKLSNEKYTTKSGEVKSAFRFLILEAEIADSNGSKPSVQSEKPAAAKEEETKDDDELPF